MYRSIAKILVLMALIISSIILTYKIWNFKPELTDVQNTEIDKSPTIGPKYVDNIKNIFMPFQVVDYSEQKIKGTTQSEQIMAMTEYLSGSKIRKSSELMNNSNFLSKEINNRYVIFDFTLRMPDTMYLASVLDMAYDNNHRNMFKRMLIDSRSARTITLYLLGDDHISKIETTAKSREFNQLLQKNKSMVNYTGIITNDRTTDEKTSLYAPTSGKHAKAYRFMADRINVEDINNAVLDDKEHVIERSRKDGTTYFSNTGVVSVTSNEIYKYNNLSETDNTKKVPAENLVKTFDFISGHGGFTDEYRLFSVNRKDHAVEYQMFMNNLPVFSRNNLSSINVIWGKEKEYEYRRGLLRTSVAVPSKKTAKKLPTAEEIRFALATSKHYKLEDVTQLLIGYEMKKSDDSEIQATLTFDPA